MTFYTVASVGKQDAIITSVVDVCDYDMLHQYKSSGIYSVRLLVAVKKDYNMK